ncbi:MAG: hypothetical protein WB239_14925 [Acidimicrobiia bacterium]
MERARPVLLLLGVAVVVLGAVVLGGRMLTRTPVSTTATADGGQREATAPIVEGGTLTLSGDRNTTVEFAPEVRNYFDRGAYELTASDGRISFAMSDDGQPLVDHLTIGDLDFFLSGGDCRIVVNRLHADLGLAETSIDCPDISDIHQKATVGASGQMMVAANAVMAHRDDLPETGGTVSVGGDLTFEVALEPEKNLYAVSPDTSYDYVVSYDWPVITNYDPQLFGDVPWISLANVATTQAEGGDTVYQSEAGLNISQNESSDQLWVSSISGRLGDEFIDGSLEEGACPVSYQQVGVLAPGITEQQLTVDCTGVEAAGVGTVSIHGSVVVRRIESEWP